MSIMGSSVSKAQNWGWVQSFFFFKECCFRVRVKVRVRVDTNPNCNLTLPRPVIVTPTLKQQILNHGPGPGSPFY